MGGPNLENRLVTIRGRWIHIDEEVEMSVRECLWMQRNLLNSWRIWNKCIRARRTCWKTMTIQWNKQVKYNVAVTSHLNFMTYGTSFTESLSYARLQCRDTWTNVRILQQHDVDRFLGRHCTKLLRAGTGYSMAGWSKWQSYFEKLLYSIRNTKRL